MSKQSYYFNLTPAVPVYTQLAVEKFLRLVASLRSIQGRVYPLPLKAMTHSPQFSFPSTFPFLPLPFPFPPQRGPGWSPTANAF